MADAAGNPEDKDVPTRALDDDDIALLKTYGLGPYSVKIKDAEKDLKELSKKVNDVCGVKESDTGLAAPSRWDLRGDKQVQQAEQPLQVCIPQLKDHEHKMLISLPSCNLLSERQKLMLANSNACT